MAIMSLSCSIRFLPSGTYRMRCLACSPSVSGQSTASFPQRKPKCHLPDKISHTFVGQHIRSAPQGRVETEELVHLLCINLHLILCRIFADETANSLLQHEQLFRSIEKSGVEDKVFQRFFGNGCYFRFCSQLHDEFINFVSHFD